MTTQTPVSSASPGKSPAVVAIDKIEQDLKTLIEDIKSQYEVDTSGDLSLAGLWFSDVPKLSLACADVYEKLQSYFEAADFTPQDLRDNEEAVRRVEELLAYINKAMTQLNTIFAALRKQLCVRTQMVVDQLDSLKTMPFLSADKKSDVDNGTAPVDQILADRKANRLVAVGKTTQHKKVVETTKASTDAALQAKEQEISVLRGGSLFCNIGGGRQAGQEGEEGQGKESPASKRPLTRLPDSKTNQE